jgi:hypothetical protein
VASRYEDKGQSPDESRSIPLPRTALDDQETDTPKRRPDDESWDDMIARFGDTWT